MRTGPLQALLIRAVLVLTVVAIWPAAAAATTPLNPAVQINSMSCTSGGNCTAVGDYLDGVDHGQGLLFTEAGGVWATGTEAPLPVNAAFNPLDPANNTGVVNVRCVSPGNCAAVGLYTDATNNDRGLLLTERGGKWQRGIEARLPSDVMPPAKNRKTVQDNLVILSVACTSVGNCYAVGNYVTSANTLQPLIVAERNGKWLTGTVAPLPVGAAVRGQKAVLYSVTCLPTNTCTAVGAYVDADGDQQAMLLTANSGVWSAVTEATLPSDAGTSPAATPIALDCVAAGDCTAVGYFQDSHTDSLGVMLNESSGSWSTGTQALLPTNAAPPTSYNAQTTVLGTLTCPDATDCTAGGSYTDAYGNTQAVLISEAAGTWGTGQEVSLPSNSETTATDQTAGIDAVSCPSVGNCVAGGDYTDTAENNDSLLVTETNGVWSAATEAPLPSNAGQAQYSAVEGVNCSSVGNCTVIGTYDTHFRDGLAYAIQETNGVWGSARALAAPAASSLEVELSVESLLIPVGKDATVAAIRRLGRFELPYTVVKPGKLTVTWFSTDTSTSTKAKANTKTTPSVLVASASVNDKTAGSGKLELRLTRAGHKLFAAGGTVKLTSSVVFTPAGGRAVTETQSFKLK
jgi:hypothetical protein